MIPKLWSASLFGPFRKDPRCTSYGTAGTGAALPLAELPGAPAGDFNPDDNWQNLDVDAAGAQGSDLAAVGARVSGAAGAVAETTVGVRNNGPATLDWIRGHGSPGVVVVTIPAGATVVTVPKGCGVADDTVRTKPGAVQYACFTDPLLIAGQTVTWTFGLRVDQVTLDATGAVEVNPACSCQRFAADIDKSNDTAAIALNPTGTPSPTATASASASASPSATAGASEFYRSA